MICTYKSKLHFATMSCNVELMRCVQELMPSIWSERCFYTSIDFRFYWRNWLPYCVEFSILHGCYFLKYTLVATQVSNATQTPCNYAAFVSSGRDSSFCGKCMARRTSTHGRVLWIGSWMCREGVSPLSVSGNITYRGQTHMRPPFSSLMAHIIWHSRLNCLLNAA